MGLFFPFSLAQAQRKLRPVSASTSFYQLGREVTSNLMPADRATTHSDASCTLRLHFFFSHFRAIYFLNIGIGEEGEKKKRH